MWWLLTLTGSLGVFMAADLVSFYLLFSDGQPGRLRHDHRGRHADAQRVGLIYVALAVFGEALLLMAFVMLAQSGPNGGFLIRDAVAALPSSPWRNAILALMIGGFGVKLGMVPFHVWMPITYRTAPIPAAAVLSGAAVKAGVIGLLRFLPLGVALPAWGEVLTTLGFIVGLLRRADRHRADKPAGWCWHSPASARWASSAAVFGMGLSTAYAGVALIVGVLRARTTRW